MNANILSIDGGGYRGIITLTQLIRFEEKLGCKIHEKFQFIAGTSTGGIIAVLLSLGYSANEIMDIYLKYGDKIFDKQFLRFGLFRSKYSDKGFNELIEKFIGDKKLSDVKSTILIPTYNISKLDKVLFKSNKSEEKDFYLKDIVRSTASAPTYFNCTVIDGDNYIDGGLVVNNPSLMIFLEVMKINSKEVNKYKKFNLISFSTGTKLKQVSKRKINGGKINGIGSIMDIILTEQAKLVDYTLNQLYNFLIPELTGKRIGMYVRCESIVNNSSGEIDDTSPSNIRKMRLDGLLSFRKNRDKINEFIKNII